MNSAKFSPNKILFVFNLNAGLRKKRIAPSEIAEFCMAHNIIFQIAIINRDDINRIFIDFKPDLVVAAGGDGTINAAGKLVVNTEIPLGVIPLGSSNGFAKNMGIPIDTQQALHLLLHGHIKTIDTLTVNDMPCFHLSDIGINARLVSRSHHSKIRGWATYFFNLVKELLTFHFFRYSVTTSHDKLSAKAFAIVITNLKKFGTNAEINPDGKYDDGLFEICIVKPFPIYRLFYMVYELFRKNINHSGYSIFIRTKEATILNHANENMHIDGEPVKKRKEINIKIVPKSLKVLVP